MAIHPRYATAILSGGKRVEFRKRRLAADVRVVLIYATTPIQRVIGAFEIESTHIDSPAEIWRTYGTEGLIERDAFDAYYAESASAVAIEFLTTWKFEHAVPLREIHDSLTVPQSFMYLELSALSAVAKTLVAASREQGSRAAVQRALPA
jgi:predicted transcriptional regulator